MSNHVIFGIFLITLLLLCGCARFERAFDRAWVNYEKYEDRAPRGYVPYYAPYSRGCVKIEQWSNDPRPGGRINRVPDTEIRCNR